MLVKNDVIERLFNGMNSVAIGGLNGYLRLINNRITFKSFNYYYGFMGDIDIIKEALMRIDYYYCICTEDESTFYGYEMYNRSYRFLKDKSLEESKFIKEVEYVYNEIHEERVKCIIDYYYVLLNNLNLDSLYDYKIIRDYEKEYRKELMLIKSNVKVNEFKDIV